MISGHSVRNEVQASILTEKTPNNVSKLYLNIPPQVDILKFSVKILYVLQLIQF